VARHGNPDGAILFLPMVPERPPLFPIESDEGFFSGLGRRASTDWVEGSASFAQGIEGMSTPEKRSHLGSSVPPKGIVVAFSLLGILALLIVGRLVQIQLFQGDYYARRSEINRERVQIIPAERGLIFDRFGIELTKNVPNFSLLLTPQDAPRDKLEREYMIRKLAILTGEVPKVLRDHISRGLPVVIQENIPYDMALIMRIRAEELPGVDVVEGSKRQYLLGETTTGTPPVVSLSHVLGYEGKITGDELSALREKGYRITDTLGKTGVEKTYEVMLRGVAGIKRREVDFLEREQKIITETPAIPGHHLRLTLDMEMQRETERILGEALKRYGKKKGAAIAMDPRSGEILALVSLPAFNNNDFSGGISREAYAGYITNPDEPLFHRALAGTYPSGSTIKPVIAAAALQEDIITPRTTVNSTGGIQVGPRFFPDWQAGGHGITDVRKSIAWSVNTFYYYIGGGFNNFTGLGVDVITRYMRMFGLGERLGVDIPGEQSGFVPSPAWKEEKKGERWYIGDTYNLSIGQGDLLVTPLQIASMTATIANGGTIYVPHIVGAIEAPGDLAPKVETPKIIRQIDTPNDVLTVVREGMHDCVAYAACRRLYGLPADVAGKTGTAQWNANYFPHAWFTSFAPYDNPEIVFTVIIEEGEAGGSAAVPVGYDFFKWWGEKRYTP
jgi:penicillin-binding protein 2